jgi:hypothetical protein
MDNKIKPNKFLEKYNLHYQKSFKFNKELSNKKEVSLKTLISAFLPILHKDWKKSIKIKKGGDGTPIATDTIKNSVNDANLNNFFNYFPRNPEFTNVHVKSDLAINQTANEYPAVSTFSRSSF